MTVETKACTGLDNNDQIRDCGSFPDIYSHVPRYHLSVCLYCLDFLDFQRAIQNFIVLSGNYNHVLLPEVEEFLWYFARY